MVFVHAFAGAIAGRGFINNKSKKTFAMRLNITLIYLSAIVGSVFPDFDLLLFFINKDVDHRRLVTHSLLFYSSVLLLLWLVQKRINFAYSLSFYIGVLTHLFLDFVTGGIAMFVPVSSLVIGIPLSFEDLPKIPYIVTYLTSGYMFAEFAVAIWYLMYVLKSEKNIVARVLPFMFCVIAGLALVAYAVV